MHTQPRASQLGSGDGTERNRRATVRRRDPSAEEIEVLRLISEQVAIPLDQLARFLEVEAEEAARVARRLEEAGCVKQSRFLAGHAPWVWLTSRGAGLSGTAFGPLQTLTVRLLTHRRAINEVRLYLARRAPEGRWVCEREVKCRLEPNVPLPDAVFEIGGERHAIEVELNRKVRPALSQVIASHSNRYDAVLYFCGPQVRTLLDEKRERHDWPKLIVRNVPGMQRMLTTRSRGFGCAMRDPRPQKPPPGRRRPRKRRTSLQPWECRVLQLISEQGAIPLDQFARFLDCDVAAAKRIVRHFCGGALAKRGYLWVEEPEWIWLTERGTRFSTASFKTYLPAPGALARLRAINEVRLHIAKGAPEARWIGWRTLRRELSGAGQIPNAVVEIGGERHAIEVELTRKEKEDAAQMIAHRSARYDAVICFCTPKARRFYGRLAAENHWPKLIIRDLPQVGATSLLEASRRRISRTPR